jgi:hypothetical protein
VLGFTLITVFNICMAATYKSNPDGAFWGFGIILGVGTGIILPLTMVAAQLATTPELISSASALIISTRSLGGTVGLAITNAIFNSALSTEIPKKIAAAVLPLGLPPSSLGMLIGALASNDQALLAHVPGATPQIIGAAAQGLVEAYGIGFRNCWIAACCFAALAIVGKFRDLPLTDKFSNCNWAMLTIYALGSILFYDPKDQFNAHVDAPAEERVIEKQARLEGAAPVTTVEPKHAEQEIVERV